MLTKIPKFRRCVIQNFPFIEEDFDALTDYELLCKVVEYLNKVITSQNEVVEATAGLLEAFDTLKNYVDTYFDNLDIQDEINNKLDQMAEDGTLQEIIGDYLQTNVAWTFDTVAEMKLSINLVNGSYARTLGFHSADDGGGALYYITNSGTANEMDVIAVGDLYANLVTNKIVNVKQFGAYGDDSHDDYSVIARAIVYAKNNELRYIFFPAGQYLTSEVISVPNNITIEGEKKSAVTIKKTTNNVDPIHSVDAVIMLEKDSGDYNTGQHLKNLLILGNYTNTYGIYAHYAVNRMLIEDCQVSRVLKGIYLKLGGWLSSIVRTTITPVTDGLVIDGGTSTTLTFNEIYVNGGSGYGYYLKGVGYSGMTNIACDSNTGSPYFFSFSNFTINGFGCECPNANNAITIGTDSFITISNGTILPNATNASYVCISGAGNSYARFNNIKINTSEASIAGKFLAEGNGFLSTFTDCTAQAPFSTANTSSNNRNYEQIKEGNGNYISNINSTFCGIGKVSVGPAYDDFADKTNISNKMGAIVFNNRANPKFSLDGYNRNDKNAFNLGDLFVNQAPAVNGIAIFQQVSDRNDNNFANAIASVNISGTTGSITLDNNLDLVDYAKNRGLAVKATDKVKSSSGGTGTVASIDEGTQTINLTSVSGSFTVGDTLTLTGRALISNSEYKNIQSIGYGNSASRPASAPNGYMYFDTTLVKPIWKHGTTWRDATGTTVS